MKKLLIIFVLLGFCCQIRGEENKISTEEKMEWWQDAKFGMFVHWGPYAIYGGVYKGHNQRRGGAEWIMNRCKIPVREYRAAASTFNPVCFNADSLVLMAKDAGMKYIVFTTKHHDGFAMFDSDASNFNIVDYTPYGRDIVDDVVKACRKHGMRIGFYYSQSQDWCNPGGNAARKEMWEGWQNPDSLEINAYTKAHNGAWDPLQTSKTFEEYFYGVSLPQIKELLSRYGDELGVVFFDTPQHITKKQAEDVMAEFAKYPKVILNDRLKRPDFPGDYKTPEGRIPKAEDIEGIYWETCMNIGSSWGYKSWEKAWKSSSQIARNLLTIAGLGGNYLLNVGPDACGEVPAEARQCLKEVGEWMKTNGEAIYGTRRSNIRADWGAVSRKDEGKNTVLYVCVFDRPADGKVTVPCKLGGRSASLLADGSDVKIANKKGNIEITLPEGTDDPIATVVKLELKGKLPQEKLISNSDKVFKIVDAD
ncbi:MAG: alpha-L-fucosidase [Duncaniella sp.]|nr:alpha-L-fucosidase [Duncaniella sp.]